MTGATKLTTKGQVVIPKRIRDHLSWRPGTRLSVEELPDGGVRLSVRLQARLRTQPDPIERACGLLRGTDFLADLEAEHRTEVKADGRGKGRRR
jgi:AbrB family looped-hinge helix DNA binding protein